MPPWLENLPAWCGDIHELLPMHLAGVIVTTAAIFGGGLIGFERGRAQKPAGLRTMILICLGSAIFTQASLLLGGDPNQLSDRTRIAAQIVSGIGFLGAGAIIRERGRVVGFTTGAGIWATAAVGVVVGSGHVAAGLFFAVLIFFTLSAAKGLEHVLVGRCRYATVRVTYDDRDGKTRILVDQILHRFHLDRRVNYEPVDERHQRAVIHYCHHHRHHRSVLNALATLETVSHIATD